MCSCAFVQHMSKTKRPMRVHHTFNAETVEFAVRRLAVMRRKDPLVTLQDAINDLLAYGQKRATSRRKRPAKKG